jgi:hypothetical protein
VRESASSTGNSVNSFLLADLAHTLAERRSSNLVTNSSTLLALTAIDHGKRDRLSARVWARSAEQDESLSRVFLLSSRDEAATKAMSSQLASYVRECGRGRRGGRSSRCFPWKKRTRARSWLAGSSLPWSRGYGGTNAHIIMERAPTPARQINRAVEQDESLSRVVAIYPGATGWATSGPSGAIRPAESSDLVSRSSDSAASQLGRPGARGVGQDESGAY